MISPLFTLGAIGLIYYLVKHGKLAAGDRASQLRNLQIMMAEADRELRECLGKRSDSQRLQMQAGLFIGLIGGSAAGVAGYGVGASVRFGSMAASIGALAVGTGPDCKPALDRYKKNIAEIDDLRKRLGLPDSATYYDVGRLRLAAEQSAGIPQKSGSNYY